MNTGSAIPGRKHNNPSIDQRVPSVFLKRWSSSENMDGQRSSVRGRKVPKFPERLGRNARHIIPSLRTVEWKSQNGGEDGAKALLMFRNAPIFGGASPTRVVFGQPLRVTLPAHRRGFAPEWQQEADKLEKKSEVNIRYTNKIV